MNDRLVAPGASGLYDPSNEHDACGIALVAKLWGEASHAVVEKALDALENLESIAHRSTVKSNLKN